MERKKEQGKSDSLLLTRAVALGSECANPGPSFPSFPLFHSHFYLPTLSLFPLSPVSFYHTFPFLIPQTISLDIKHVDKDVVVAKEQILGTSNVLIEKGGQVGKDTMKKRKSARLLTVSWRAEGGENERK